MSVTSTELPVISRISNEIVDRLQALVTTQAGAYTFCGVVRPTRISTYTPANGLIVVTRGEYVRVPEMDCPGNPPAIAYQQTFLVRVHIAPSEDDDTPVETYEDIVEAEIIKALRSSSTWHTFGDNAINATFQPAMLAKGDGAYDGIAIPVDVVFRIAEDDPYTARG